MCASSLSRRLSALERGAGPAAHAEEIRRAMVIDEFLAQQLGREPKSREQIDTWVKAGRRQTELPRAILDILNAHLRLAPK